MADKREQPKTSNELLEIAKKYADNLGDENLTHGERLIVACLIKEILVIDHASLILTDDAMKQILESLGSILRGSG